MEKREIKFRAWDTRREDFRSKPEPRMVYNVTPFVSNEYGDWYIKQDWNSNTYDQDIDWEDNVDQQCNSRRGILTQYTGLKDKKGKEIYFDDIVEDVNCNIGVIVWNCDRISLKIGDEFRQITHYDLCEIIGNIYENPELLNNK